MIFTNILKSLQSITIKTKNLRLFSQVFNKDIIFEKLQNTDTGIAVIGLNRPKARNSINVNLVTEFENSLKNIQNDKQVRVVIIKSHIPNIFCAGADLKERLTLKPDEVGKFVTRLRNLMTTVYNLQVPVIAALDGIALGGGLELALSCDIRTASTSAKLGLVETKLAIIPGAGGTQRLSRIITPAFAKELIYTARVLDGSEAEKYGIVNHAIKQNENGDAAYLKALDVAREIIPNGPFAIKMAKEAINKGLEVDLRTALNIEEACYEKIIPTQDRIEGLKAFNEKRTPIYIGE